MWLAPSLRVKYGPYFRLEATEQKSTVDFVQSALGHGAGMKDAPALITRRQAVEILAPIVGIENVDAAMDALEQEVADDADAAAEKLKAAQAAMGTQGVEPADGEKPSAPKPADPKE
jgi:hypothetical protein